MIEEIRASVKAVAFAKRGYPVLALHGIIDGACTCGNDQCHSPGKHPHPLSPRGKDSATTDAAEVKAWFREYPEINYGVCTDTLPTIDIDPRNGGDEAWLKLVKENYDVHSWRVATGGGGQHIIFGVGRKPLPSGKLARGVDIKGAGGYIVGVGSKHASGKQYRWFPHCEPRNVDLAAMPRWVVKQLVGKTGEWDNKPRDQSYFNKFLEPALPGERHERVASLLGHLFGSAFPNRAVLLALVISHVRLTFPDQEGFGDDEIVQIARDLVRAEHKKREAVA